jgi:hypothetical protein
MCLIINGPKYEDLWVSGGVATPYITSVLYVGQCECSSEIFPVSFIVM